MGKRPQYKGVGRKPPASGSHRSSGKFDNGCAVISLVMVSGALMALAAVSYTIGQVWS